MSVPLRALAIERLKQRLAALEPRREDSASPKADVTPWRDLTPGALHEIAGRDWRDGPATDGYALALVSRLTKHRQGAVVWIALKSEVRDAGRPYAPDNVVYGLARDRIALCFAKDMAALLWAAEEAARERSTAAVIIDARKPHRLLNLTSTRRIQLAGEASGATPILIRSVKDCEPTCSHRRFRVSASASAAEPYDPSTPGAPRWRVEIERCRLGKRGAWVVEWDHASGELREAQPVPLPLSPAVADGSVQAIEAVA